MAIESELKKRGIGTQLRGAGRFFASPLVVKAISALRALQVGSTAQPLFMELSKILTALGWTSRSDGSETWHQLNWFVEIFDELSEPSLDEYLRELGERERTGDEPQREAVTLATIHATKGLEWETVFLCGANDGLFPISHAKTPEQIAEERRLFYVGVTRARDSLILSWVQDRTKSEFVDLALGSRN